MTAATRSPSETMHAAMDERRYIWLSFHDKCFMGFILGRNAACEVRSHNDEESAHAARP